MLNREQLTSCSQKNWEEKMKKHYKEVAILLAPFGTVFLILGLILAYLSDGKWFMLGGLWFTISRFVPGVHPLKIEDKISYDMGIGSLYLLVSFIVLLLIILGKFLEVKFCKKDKSNVKSKNISISE